MTTAAIPAVRILVIDDEPDLRTLYELTLLREGYHVETAACVDDARLMLSEGRFDLVITDMRLPDGSGLDVLRWLEQADRRERAIVITAYGSAENAVEALKAGAFDYLTKPVDLKQFRQAVASALTTEGDTSPTLRDLAALKRAESVRPAAATPVVVDGSGRAPGVAAAPAAPLPEPSAAMSRLVGRSPAIQEVRALIEKVARSMAPVLLWGESGTGKELVARAVHDVSSRRGGPFVAVNCGAIPEQLLEAEFFGYRKGAFTGAQDDREGFFQAARGGTLFLDEIGDLPLSMQSKLLRAIQERAVRPVGAVAEIPMDVRILSASHKDLGHEVTHGRFRQDLYYRLNVIQITLPALRERLDDLPLICEQVLRRIAQESGFDHEPLLRPSALWALQQYRFPGNVRELENILHRAVALSGGHVIEADDLALPEAPPQPPGHAPVAERRSPPLQPPLNDLERQLPTPPATTLAPASVPAVPLPSDLVEHLDRIERDILVKALEKHHLNRTAAGASLGLSLRQMRYRMARLGVQVSAHGVEIGERQDPDSDEASVDAP